MTRLMISDDATSRAQSGADTEAGGDGMASRLKVGLRFSFGSSRPGSRPCLESHSGDWGRGTGGGGCVGGGVGQERDEQRSPSAHKRAAAAMIA